MGRGWLQIVVRIPQSEIRIPQSRGVLIHPFGWVNFGFMNLPFQVTKNITLLGSELFNLYLVKGETYAIVEGGVSGVTYPFFEQLKQLDVPPEAISHLVILHSH